MSKAVFSGAQYAALADMSDRVGEAQTPDISYIAAAFALRHRAEFEEYAAGVFQACATRVFYEVPA